MHLYNCIWVVLLVSRLNLDFLSPKLSHGIDIVLVFLCPCRFDNPRNTLRWKLLQLASVRLQIILFGLRTTNRGWAIILHMMTFQKLRTAMTSPSTPLRRWRSMSPSAVESLLTLVSTMWTYLRGLVWMRSFPPSSRPLVGETLHWASSRFASLNPWISYDLWSSWQE
jgi:hypothetical protein